MSIAGVLEIELLANLARLSTDMKRAERVMSDSTSAMSKSVSGLQDQLSRLGMGASFAVMFDQMRRLTDDYVKLTAQMRIATKTQAEYTQGMADVRRISTAAQADINATTMLYTRLTNSLSQYGVSQKQIGTITESVSLGLKAYGATTAEASSAMLQLSQAFGSGRLGGEEFRAVSEAMPPMMKILAESMGVPLSAMKKLSAEGELTPERMAKAWSNPAVLEMLRKQADATRTITGEVIVLRNELKLFVGEAMTKSGATSGLILLFKELSESLKSAGDNMRAIVSVMAVLGDMIRMLANVTIVFATSIGQMASAAVLLSDGVIGKGAGSYERHEARLKSLREMQSNAFLGMADNLKLYNKVQDAYDVKQRESAVKQSGSLSFPDVENEKKKQAELKRIAKENEDARLTMLVYESDQRHANNELQLEYQQAYVDGLKELDKQEEESRIATLVYLSDMRHAKNEDDLKRQNDALEKAYRDEQELMKTMSKNIGDILYDSMTGAFVDIGAMFKKLLARMASDAMATQLVVGLSTSMFGTAATASTAATAGSIGAGGMMATITPFIIPIAAAVAMYYGTTAVKNALFGSGEIQYGEAKLRGYVTNAVVSAVNTQSWSMSGGLLGGGKSGENVWGLSDMQSRRIRYDADNINKILVEYGTVVGDTTIATREYKADVGNLSDSMATGLLPQLKLYQLEGETLIDTAKRMTAVFKEQIDAINASRDAIIAEATANRDAAAQQILDSQKSVLSAISALSTASKSIRDFAGTLNIGSADIIASEFYRIAKLAATGDITAQGRLQGAASSYLASGRMATSSAAEYARLNASVVDTLLTTAGSLDEQKTIAEQQLSALDDIVKSTNDLKLIEQWTKATVDNAAITANNVLSVAAAVDMLALQMGRDASGNYTGGYMAITAQGSAAVSAAEADAAAKTRAIADKQALDAKIAVRMEAMQKVANWVSMPWIDAGAVASADYERSFQLVESWVKYAKSSGLPNSGTGAQIVADYDAYKSLPAYADGSNFIATDHVAMVHAGEEIKPKPYVDKDRADKSQTNNKLDGVIAELQQLRSDNVAERFAMSRALQKVELIVDKWDKIGLPETQTA